MSQLDGIHDPHHHAWMVDMGHTQETHSAQVINEDRKEFMVFMAGPPGTGYESGTFKIRLAFPDNYPNGVPEAKFLVPIWNCHVDWDTQKVIFDRVDEGEPLFTIEESLKYIEAIMKSNQEEKESIYVKTTQFWTVYTAQGRLGPCPDMMQKLGQLQDMGFGERDSILALSRSEWDADQAVEAILAGSIADDEPSHNAPSTSSAFY
ncbi:CBN-UBC-22 protein [Caenorhabditis brenneri]|uniref:CBN-UBC-22 protein n=1 Tax=Caenorhabditis brenneri TaxID=135651 RepID=G0MYL6_CAEBE|nr:CBN-UBC-22 protein [Caenorhabditis brenneri]